MKILVTGGAGYIGSITVKELQQRGHEVIVFDSLVNGHPQSIDCPLIKGDLINKQDIKSLFDKNKFEGVIHFANLAVVNESMTIPGKYFEMNLQGGLNLLEGMRSHNLNKIVFSSSAGVYGYPKEMPINEDVKDKKPVSVYGETKLMFERILEWYGQLHDFKVVSLRYFNACGATLDGSLGEDHSPESHLIPIIMQAALGVREKMFIYGNNYKTRDGTCLRDYIHVLDLASAHIKSLDYLNEGGKSEVFNVGTGVSCSVLEVINKVKQITHRNFTVENADRRAGDPGELCADNSKIKKVLNWEPKYSDLETIISSAWKWHQSHPNGYATDNKQ